MKERPILFKADMVNAILGGTKTQTRRIIKPQPEWVSRDASIPRGTGFQWITNRFTLLRWPDKKEFSKALAKRCPHGQPGDRMWVRETFRLYDASIECGCSEAPCNCPTTGTPIYRADSDNPESKWKPSIFMPRKVSRILLEITAIRVEQLHDISEEDAISEGVDAVSMESVPRQATMSRRADYKQLWESINPEKIPVLDEEGKKTGMRANPARWAANPWVWVVEFKPIEGKQL